jgi:hypothetical protein
VVTEMDRTRDLVERGILPPVYLRLQTSIDRLGARCERLEARSPDGAVAHPRPTLTLIQGGADDA